LLAAKLRAGRGCGSTQIVVRLTGSSVWRIF
jgi:hypothetical protein